MEQPSRTTTVLDFSSLARIALVARKSYSARKRARREARAESRITALIAEYRGLLLNYGKVIARIAAIDVEHAELALDPRCIPLTSVYITSGSMDRRRKLVRQAKRKLERMAIVRAKLEAAGCTFVFPPQRGSRARGRTVLIQAPTFDCHFLWLPCHNA